MTIKRYIADKDTTITNAFKSNLTTRGTGSNMGGSDILEVFSIYGQADSGSLEKTRFLVNFPVSTISSDRTAGTIPASGSVNFYLRMFNARHAYTLPRDYTLTITAVSRSWEEGSGVDMDEYTDITHDAEGANWINAASGTTWTTQGGDYHTAAYNPGTTMPTYNPTFSNGTEDIEVDVTSMVEEWLTNTYTHQTNYGVGVALTASQEGASRSYYTKKFFGRTSDSFFKRPYLEARWNSAKKDDRGNFYASSSLASATDNLNTLYLYNYVRGKLSDIPGVGTGNIYLQVYTARSSGSVIKTTTPKYPVTGGHVSTGIYSASFALTTTATTVYDRWFKSGLATCYHTGTVSVNILKTTEGNPKFEYATKITNIKPVYARTETARMRLFARQKDWSPTIYSVANTIAQNSIIESGSYRVVRMVDGLEVVPFGTGSTLHTQLSFDVTGSYFDFDMSLLQSGYAYAFQVAYYNGVLGGWVEQPELYKFRVE
tara:strand:+ start:2579 stop:4039 length:1461 start_codon:yes stop_codon:yes gene_type:complete